MAKLATKEQIESAEVWFRVGRWKLIEPVLICRATEKSVWEVYRYYGSEVFRIHLHPRSGDDACFQSFEDALAAIRRRIENELSAAEERVAGCHRRLAEVAAMDRETLVAEIEKVRAGK